jgi:ribosomal protein S17E
MGKIKSRLVKRTAERFINDEVGFGDSFEKNKRILKNDLPSKKVRNQLAGYLARLKRRNNSKLNK